MASFDWAVEVSEQPIWKHYGLVLESMKMFVAVVGLALMAGRMTHWTDGAVDKPPDMLHRGSTVEDGPGIAFKVCG